MKLLSPVFSTNRMVGEYADRYYLPTATAYRKLSADGFARARALAAWKARIEREWASVGVEHVGVVDGRRHTVGESLPVTAQVRLGSLDPEMVAVEAYVGILDANREITAPTVVPLRYVEALGNGRHRYIGEISCDQAGMTGYTIRVRPHHPDASNAFLTGLMTWG
jgi:starch phosphorylase